jgi:hypothetical protein
MRNGVLAIRIRINSWPGFAEVPARARYRLANRQIKGATRTCLGRLLFPWIVPRKGSAIALLLDSSMFEVLVPHERCRSSMH